MMISDPDDHQMTQKVKFNANNTIRLLVSYVPFCRTILYDKK